MARHAKLRDYSTELTLTAYQFPLPSFARVVSQPVYRRELMQLRGLDRM